MKTIKPVLFLLFTTVSCCAQWQPAAVTSWQWQLSSVPSSSQLLPVNMYDVDGFDASASLVSAMHSKSIHAVCYISVGTWENWRPDASLFPASSKGKSNGWPGEEWLDIRSSAVRQLMSERFQMCQSKGFDAVEPDSMDGYTNATGFPLTASDQLDFNRWVANEVHSYGMAVFQKNDVEQTNELQPYFDAILDEQCFQYSECDTLSPYRSANKAVFEVEYAGKKNVARTASKICPKANAMNFNTLIKDMNLTAARTACR